MASISRQAISIRPFGYETVPAPDNFFYTRAYALNSGEPFTHTGLLGNYTVNANWSVLGGATTGSATGGWDGGFDKQLDNWGGLAGVIWTSDDKRTSATIGGTYGQTATPAKEPWVMYSVVLQHRITPKMHFVLHHNHGWVSGVLLNGVNKNAEWYSVNTHLTYDLLNDLSSAFALSGSTIETAGVCSRPTGYFLRLTTGGLVMLATSPLLARLPIIMQSLWA